MKFLPIYLYVFFCSLTVYGGGVYGDTIRPVTFNDLQDSIFRHEVASILNGHTSEYFSPYKTKGIGNSIASNYKKYSWRFNVFLKNSVRTSATQGRYETDCLQDNPLIDKIIYGHINYELVLEGAALSIINKEITAACGGQPLVLDVKSYISKDRRRNYLYLYTEGENKKMVFVFIITNSTLYWCVHSMLQ